MEGQSEKNRDARIPRGCMSIRNIQRCVGSRSLANRFSTGFTQVKGMFRDETHKRMEFPWLCTEEQKNTGEKLEISSDFKRRAESVKEFNLGSVWRKRGISRVPIVYHVKNRPTPGKVSILSDGSVVVEVAGIEMGQGLWTTDGCVWSLV